MKIADVLPVSRDPPVYVRFDEDRGDREPHGLISTAVARLERCHDCDSGGLIVILSSAIARNAHSGDSVGTRLER